MDVIWVGGASLPEDLAAASRAMGLKLAPCYGATETAAMVTAQRPRDFLTGGTAVASLSRTLISRWMRMEPWLFAVIAWPWPRSTLPARCIRCPILRGGGGAEIGPGLSKLEVSHISMSGAPGWRDPHGWGHGVSAQLEERLLVMAQHGGLPLASVLMLGNRSWSGASSWLPCFVGRSAADPSLRWSP